ncbi:MAG: hypothetical protein H0X17_01105 [Deltaproteobacteria bacterium]|nr:hypothetical protein [Deltaproteobacteria bacterium]
MQTTVRRGALIAILVASACSKKSANQGPPPELTGLAAVPSSADVVLGVDVDKLASSPIVERAVEQLLMRDTRLRESWELVRDGCKIDVRKQIRRVMVALGPTAPDSRVGTGPVLMIATGSLSEAELASCVRSLVGKGGGTLTAKPLGGRTLYLVKETNRTMYFAFGRPDTVVLGTNEAYVTEALGPGKKALDHPELAGWIKLADQNAPVWAVGRVSDRVRVGLVKVTEGKLSAGPAAFVGSLDPSEGAKVDLGAVMVSPADAKQLESQAKAQLATLAMVAQLKSLGHLVQKLAITVDTNVVRFRAALTMDDVNHLLSMLDGRAPPAQDSPPAIGSGSAQPAQPRPSP